MKNSSQLSFLSNGFSLFELLIVLAIIATLTTLSFPLYNDYLIKARVIELFSMAQPTKLAVTEAILEGVEPEAIDNVKVSISPVTSPSIQELKIVRSNIIVTANNKKLALSSSAPFQLVFKPIIQSGNNIQWECGVSESTPTEFYKYLPVPCRQIFPVQ